MIYTDETKKAMILADKLEFIAGTKVNVFSSRVAFKKAAVELRRLQARVEELEKICNKSLDEAVADEWDDWYFVMKSALKSTKEHP